MGRPSLEAARAAKAGLAACFMLTAPAAGAVNLEQAVSVYESLASPAAMPSIQGGTDQTYVVFIVTESNSDVSAVSGGGLAWTERKEQCAGTNQTGIRVWTAQGSPGSPFQVQITYGGGGLDLTAALARYSGVLSLEDPTGQNVAGENDTVCSTSTQNSTAQLTLTSTQNTSVHAIGISSKNRTVSSVSSGYSLVDSEATGAAYCYVYHKEISTAATDAFSATLSGNARWATAGLVLNPVPTANYRSIGTDTGILASTGTATVAFGSSTVTFSGTTLPADVGPGDVLTIGGGAPPTLFSDAFGDGTTNGWTCITGGSQNECNMTESGGRFRTDGSGSNSHYKIDAGAAWTDYTFTIDLSVSDDDYMGITARVQDGSNYYVMRQGFGDNPPGPPPTDYYLRLQKIVGGTATNLASLDNYGTNPGQVDGNGNYVFKLQVNGTNIKAWIDGVLKFDITDSTYASGTAGVWAYSLADSWFDNASVTGNADGPYHLLSRDSDTQVTIQESSGGAWTSATYEIERAYNTLQAWEDDRDGSLVAEARREVGVCYNDGAFTGQLTISGSTTDASHHMKITAASGQRHNGIKNTGVRIDAQGGWGGSDAITVEDQYTQVEWLEIKDIDDAGDGIFFDDSPAADGSVASNLFFHSGVQNGNAGVKIGAQSVAVRNSIFTGGMTDAILLLANSSATIDNCTIVGDQASGSGVTDQAGATVTVRNTISVNHAAGDDFRFWANIAYFGYNMFDPTLVDGFDPDTCTNCAGNNKAPPADLDALFISPAGENYHLEANGHRAGNTGTDLSASFTNDVDGATRTPTWDMGADEAVSGTTPTGSPRITSWREVEP